MRSLFRDLNHPNVLSSTEGKVRYKQGIQPSEGLQRHHPAFSPWLCDITCWAASSKFGAFFEKRRFFNSVLLCENRGVYQSGTFTRDFTVMFQFISFIVKA
jgi:hypothetical protein